MSRIVFPLPGAGIESNGLIGDFGCLLSFEDVFLTKYQALHGSGGNSLMIYICLSMKSLRWMSGSVTLVLSSYDKTSKVQLLLNGTFLIRVSIRNNFIAS